MKPKEVFVAHPTPPTVPQVANQKAVRLLSEVHKPLFTVHSIFPFELFPDELIVNAVEVIYVNNIFFWTGYQTSFLIEEIGDIDIVEGPFFASLTIMPTSTITGEPIKINFLSRKNAQEARNLLQGLVILKKEHADFDTLVEEKNGIEEIIEVGKAKR